MIPFGNIWDAYQEIYPEELELKYEHHGTHATFSDLEIYTADVIFVYELFDMRNDFPFSLCECLV